MAFFFALSAAVCWGVADFLGGIQARRGQALVAAFVSQFVGAVLLVVIVLVAHIPVPGSHVIAIAVATGLVNGLAVYALYSALAAGNMARVAPVLGMSALVPLVIGLLSGERPTEAQYLGMAMAIAGVVLVSTERHTPSHDAASNRRATSLAVVAALCVGITLVGMSEASETSPYWAVLIVRWSGVSLLAVILWRSRLGWLGWRQLQKTSLTAIGLFDVAANAFWATASTLGLLSLVAVLGTLFPVVTVALAIVLLHEKLQPHQAVGATAVLLGGALITVM